jgi:para-aminobenzoate synthetase/4-amino-4-deoxychorismate lyase
VLRRRLDLEAQPVEVLRALRARPGLVGLVGAWCGGGAIVACDPVEVLAAAADPFEAVAGPAMRRDGVAEASGFGGGWIGLWGYQLGRRLEHLPPSPPRPVPAAEHWLARYEWVLRQDAEGGWWFESLLASRAAGRVLSELTRALVTGGVGCRGYRFGRFTMTPEPAEHVKAVARTLEHIAAGDIFQANLCARLEAEFEGDPLDVFCSGVEALAPPYAAFLDTGERSVVSLSPELFLRRRGRAVLSSPIKGTVPALDDPDALAASSKNRAENVMIVDLMRNDLGRVCVPGTVEVPSLARPHALAGVWHLVSDVTGRLRDEVSDADLLRATFPPGSVTGAPKVRAMELINELESTGRELYTGAIGFASPVAGLETSVVIRTLEFAGGIAWMGVGGGVVADSDPEAELAECYAKANPVLTAVGARPLDHEPPVPTKRPETPRLPPGPVAAGRPDPARGVFTTVLVRDGIPVLAEEHVARLQHSAAVLGHRLDPDALLRRLRDAAATVAVGPWRLRLTVSGDGGVQTELRPLSVSAAGSWDLAPVSFPGGLGPHKWADRDPLGRLLEQPVSDRTDLLLVDTDGTVLETGRANLFLVLDDGVHTPRADGRILPGIARCGLLRLLDRHGLPVYEHDLDLADLAGAAEVFVTNSLRGVVPVTSCAGVARWPIGRTTRWLRRALAQHWRNPDSAAVAPPSTAPRSVDGARVLLVDNYDSFAYNLAQYAQELGADVTVVRNDADAAAQLCATFGRGDFTHLVISPGPGRPEDAGASVELIRRLDGTVPVLGVCLGHQCIGQAYGARVVRAPRPVHGKPAIVHHDGRGVFHGLEGPLVAARYHSLVVDNLPPSLVPTAWSADSTLMGLRHRDHPVEGVQVHPESILTPLGHTLLANFLRRTGTTRR